MPLKNREKYNEYMQGYRRHRRSPLREELEQEARAYANVLACKMVMSEQQQREKNVIENGLTVVFQPILRLRADERERIFNAVVAEFARRFGDEAHLSQVMSMAKEVITKEMSK